MNEISITLENCATRIEAGAKTTIDGIMQAGQALAEAREAFGDNDKGFGQWRENRLPWLKSDTATRWLNVWNKFGKNLLPQNAGVDLAPSVLYLLAAPSTPDTVVEKAVAKATAGEKVTVADAKRWKEEADNVRAELTNATEEVLQLRDELQEVRQNAADEIRRLQTEQKTKIVEKEVIPADYQTTKAALVQAQAEAEKAREQLANLKKRQESEVAAQVQERIKFHQKDLAEMEGKRDRAERRLEELNEHLALISQKTKTHEYHAKTIDEWETKLLELAVDLNEFEYCDTTAERWLKLSVHFRDAAAAIEGTVSRFQLEDKEVAA